MKLLKSQKIQLLMDQQQHGINGFILIVIIKFKQQKVKVKVIIAGYLIILVLVQVMGVI